MKRIFAVILAVCLMFICGTSAIAASPPDTEIEVKPLLSEMEEDQCMEILSDLGVTVPPELKDIDLKRMVEDIEFNPDMETPGVNYMPAAQLFEDVRTAVKNYHGLTAAAATSYALQNSAVVDWNESMKSYNCYAYAIGRSDDFYQPGDFSKQHYVHTADITSVANMVKDDLQGGLGYSCVKLQSDRPPSTSGWTNVIAVRKDMTYDYYGINDFHFARLSGFSWYHKPSKTAVLRFNSPPTNSIIWTNERYDGTNNLAPDIWYESNIVYLLYKPSHGNITHTQYGYLCSDCGEYTIRV